MEARRKGNGRFCLGLFVEEDVLIGVVKYEQVLGRFLIVFWRDECPRACRAEGAASFMYCFVMLLVHALCCLY